MLTELFLCARLCPTPLTCTDSLRCPTHPSLRTERCTHFTDEQTDSPQHPFSSHNPSSPSLN